jgi:hypothetical protein
MATTDKKDPKAATQATLDVKAAKAKREKEDAEKAAAARKAARKGKFFPKPGTSIACLWGIVDEETEVTPARLHKDPKKGVEILEQLKDSGRVVEG